MIPQRNISLLANQLYKEHGGRRIPEAVLERDYCLAWFLVGLSQSKLRDLLIFKGGTALKRCHFGDYRFSEDMDFTLVRKVEFAEIREDLEEVYESIAQASGIRFVFESEIAKRTSTAIPFISAIKDHCRPQTQSRWTSQSRSFCFFQSK